jgi:hypothetical protein
MNELPDIPTLLDLVRVADPEVVANTREDLIGYAEAARARHDVIAMRDGLRAARLFDWAMAERWPVKGTTGRRGDDRPRLSDASDKDAQNWQMLYAVRRADPDDIARREVDELGLRAFRPAAAHVGHNSGVPEWYTPADIIAAARQVLGGIDLDPASSDIANDTVGADRYYTLDDDGLAQPWTGRVWMNPPYTTGLVDRFIDRLLEHFHRGDVPAACVLTNNATDTRWWQAMAEHAAAVCFPARRIRFLAPDGEKGAPLQGQTICYLGAQDDLFVDEFRKFGAVLP